MAWFSIKHSCGHIEDHQLYGPGSDRQRDAARKEKQVCGDCYAKLPKPPKPEPPKEVIRTVYAPLPTIEHITEAEITLELLREYELALEKSEQYPILHWKKKTDEESIHCLCYKFSLEAVRELRKKLLLGTKLSRYEQDPFSKYAGWR